MAVSRADLLGCALLLWAGAGLLLLFLLCNPAAADLQSRLGPTRLWGAVVGMASLGVALPARYLVAWSLPLAALPLIVLSPPLAQRVGPATLAVGVALATWGLWHRRARARRGSRRGRAPRPARPARRPWRRPSRARQGVPRSTPKEGR